MNNNIKYRRLVGSIYVLLSAFLLISLAGILFYIILMIIAGTKNLTAVPIDLTVNITQNMQLHAVSGDLIKGETTAANFSMIINQAPKWFIAFAQFHFLGIFMIGFYGILQLWQIFRSMYKHLKNEYPFYIRYVARIRKVALAFFLWAIWQFIFYLTSKIWIIRQVHIDDHQITLRFDTEIIMSLLWGLIILALAEVFRFGTELKKENDLTV